MNPQAISSRKTLLQELRRFFGRDLQDYRLADYGELSQAARHVLLLLLIPILILSLFFLWRLTFGERGLIVTTPQRTLLNEQVLRMQTDLKAYQQFLAQEKIIIIAHTLKEDQETKEVSGMQEVEASALVEMVQTIVAESSLQLITLLPRRELMMIEYLLSDKLSSSGKHYLAKPGLSLPLVSQLQPLSNAIKYRQVEAGMSSEHPRSIVIPELNIALTVCGEQGALLQFLADLQRQVSAVSTLLYLEVLNTYQNLDECSMRVHQLSLRFYPQSTIHNAYVALSQKVEESPMFPSFPVTLAQLLLFIESSDSFEGSGKEVDQRGGMGDFQELMGLIFQERTVALVWSQSPIATARLPEKLWNIGQMYQGIYLAGIIRRDQESFAIVRLPSGQWEVLKVGGKVGDLRIVQIMAEKILLDRRAGQSTDQ